MRFASKGRIFGMVTDIDDDLLKRLKSSPEILRRANEDGARYWHANFLPGHFLPEAFTKYGYAPSRRRQPKRLRTSHFAKQRHLVVTGALRDQMTARISQLTATATGVVMKLRATTLNFVPNMPDQSQELYVKQSHGRLYPNLKREVKVLLDPERQALAAVVRKSALDQLNAGTQAA